MTPAATDRARQRAGYSLIELLVAMTMLLAVTAAAWSLFQSQSKAFRNNVDRWEMIENARGALEGAQRVVRTMGAGTVSGQPVIVFGAGDVLAFNTDYIEADTVSVRWATYYNADTPVAETTAWDIADATTIPNSSPAYTYPSATYDLANGSVSPAETYIFYFEPDASTARGDDYILYQRVNNGTPEIVARNILVHPNGNPFFQYMMKRTLATGDTLMPVPDADIPLIRQSLTGAVSASDSADFVRPDSVVAVRMNFRLTNGQSGTNERFRDITTTIEVPNNGIPQASVCGRAPLAPGGLAGVEALPGSGSITFTWGSSADQDGGEGDVLQYILFRRPATATTWGGPLVVVKAVAGQSSYTATIGGNTPGTSYLFGVAAQDCTPSQSTMTTFSITPP
ncbi:MAG TPA: prepilin-type N-terminal cleavage/methylation domain-containing protein [Gemmatimonadales bacterium]|nr:prepilin-type N-terminal cleavage/methylation domain-containing protein [Gemmatimonadales bacterium]